MYDFLHTLCHDVLPHCNFVRSQKADVRKLRRVARNLLVFFFIIIVIVEIDVSSYDIVILCNFYHQIISILITFMVILILIFIILIIAIERRCVSYEFSLLFSCTFNEL